MTGSFAELMDVRGGDLPPEGEVTITGADPVYSTRFKIGDTAASVLASIGVAVSDIWDLKTGRRQNVTIDTRHAAAALRSTLYMQRPGADGTYALVSAEMNPITRPMTQPWPTKDGRWFLPHFSLAHLQARVQGVLGCEATPESVAKAVATWDALDLEAAIDEAKGCGAMVRSNAEWLDHPHGKALKAKPVVEIIKIGDSDPEPFPSGDRPLSGIRALDLTRILAGPIAARTLAENGADVLMVAAEHLPQVDEHVMDTSHGKRSCFIDLKTSEGVAQLKELVRAADVFSQGYRPGMLENLGFGAEQLAEIRPGIISLSISCFGADGPFSHRPGWEQVGQTVTGICQEGSPDRPKLLPAAACDYTTGYLGAYGALLALARRAKEGGSYLVRVSLCQSGMFIYRQGKTAPVEDGIGLSEAELNSIRIDTTPASGPLRHLGPVLKLSETQPHWSRPTPALGGDAAAWLS
jgi:crotonobetainyl-CoA:carnitine CoA-transferase CaiB-like acyl-CoA transferase